MAGFTATMLAIAATASVAGAGISAYGASQQGKTAERVANYNAAVAENDAKRLDMESREAARRQRIENRKIQSRQRSKIAKAGVAMEGSPLEIMAYDAGQMELQVQDIIQQQALQGQQLRTQAALERYSGSQAAFAGSLQAGASLLQGVGQAAGYLSAMPSGNTTPPPATPGGP